MNIAATAAVRLCRARAAQHRAAGALVRQMEAEACAELIEDSFRDDEPEQKGADHGGR